MSNVWTKWESQIVNGVFPLRRYLGNSNHSVVFLTEHKTQNSLNAAIKIVPSDPALAETQLRHWRTVAALSHPHLIRLLDTGRCELGGHQFLFVVMEYAEQTLDQILPRRALTPDEMREILPPTLDALEFLHSKGLVHGQLKAPNFLVVNDQLKLASDTIHPAAESAASAVKPSLYDPPEARSGRVSAAGDVWGLGITVTQALTQSHPAWPDDGSEALTLPKTLPLEFAGAVQRCLSIDPAGRPTINELRALLRARPQAPTSAAPQSATSEAPAAAATLPAWSFSKPGLLAASIAAGLVALGLLWAAFHGFHSHPAPQKAATDVQPSPQYTAPRAVPQNPTPPVSVPTSIVHQEIPNVPPSARETIHGRIRIAVRVTVDPSGNVVAQTFENSGSSKYFARLASEAAAKWKFVPTDAHESRLWHLRFEFTRAGTTARALPP
jgi:TonB family protein